MRVSSARTEREHPEPSLDRFTQRRKPGVSYVSADLPGEVAQTLRWVQLSALVELPNHLLYVHNRRVIHCLALAYRENDQP